VLREDIPITSPPQTLIDLGIELDPVALERTVNDADKRDLIDPEMLRDELDRFSGQQGVRSLRLLLYKLFFQLSDSDLEIYFRGIVKRAHLPIPLSKQRVNNFEVDFFWPELGLVAETDGLRYHRTPSAQTRDARRDRTHIMAGMTAPLHPLRGPLRTGPRCRSSNQNDRDAPSAHPTLNTPGCVEIGLGCLP